MIRTARLIRHSPLIRRTPLCMTLGVLAWQLFFLATAAGASMVAAPTLTTTSETLDAGDVIIHRSDICSTYIRRILSVGVDLFEQGLQLGQGLRTRNTGATFLRRLLPVHFDECNRIDHFITDINAVHPVSLHRTCHPGFATNQHTQPPARRAGTDLRNGPRPRLRMPFARAFATLRA